MTEGELAQTLSQISFTGLVALDDLLAAGNADRAGLGHRRRHDHRRRARPGRGVRGRRDEAPPRRRDQPHARPRAPRAHPLLLRGAHAGGDRRACSASPRAACARSTRRRSCSCAVACRNPNARREPGPLLTTGVIRRDCPLAARRCLPPVAVGRSLPSGASPSSCRPPTTGLAMRSPSCATPRVPRRRAFSSSSTVVAVTVVGARRRRAPARRRRPTASAGWLRPVDGRGRATRSTQPPSVYGAGHRGVDFAAAAGTPVRAANDGVVTLRRFASPARCTSRSPTAAALRTSYSFLSSVAVRDRSDRRPRRRRRVDRWRRRTTTTATVLHFGAPRRRPLRRSDAAVPPRRPHQARAARARRRARRDAVVAGPGAT